MAFDVLVVGGGPAELSAALTLGRARRRVLLASHGPPRNAVAAAAHNVFTRDGTSPHELLHAGRVQLARYAVTVRDEMVVER
jgi:thioredoxin reductase